MASWSKRRKTTYATLAALVLIAAAAIPAYVVFYTPPSCFDGLQNGSEQGVDCGGACQKLCASAFLAPEISWTRFEEVAPGLYNIAAYIINPNTDGEAFNVPYQLALYDDRGILITEKTGTVTLPPHRNTIAFVPAVSVGKRIPSKALFQFTGIPDWHTQEDMLSALVIGDKKYQEDEIGSSLAVTLSNPSVRPLGRMSVYAALFDGSGNAVGFSKTIVDGIPAGGSAIAPFTWPKNRNGAVVSIEVLPVAE